MIGESDYYKAILNYLHRGDADEHKQQQSVLNDDHVVYAYGDVLYVYAPPGLAWFHLTYGQSGPRKQSYSLPGVYFI